MATVTAAPRPTRTRPDPTRRLWQLPVFLLGVAAFAAAYYGWLPVGPPDPAAAFRKDVAALKTAGERLAQDPAELKARVSRVAADLDTYRDLAPAAHAAVGGGYVRLAELTVAPDEAKGYWVLAKQHFDAVPPDHLTDPADRPRLVYRAAKARAADLPAGAAAADIDLTRELLARTPSGEDAGDGPRLVAELSLRLVPPDYKKAKEALAAYIADAVATPRGSVERAKLRLSEVYLALGESEAAKKSLAQINPDAPPDVLPVAKAQLARIRMAEGDWIGAAAEWEHVRSGPAPPAGLRASSAYYLGVCLMQAKPQDAVAAAKLFDEAAKADGPEGAAAAARLADLCVRAPDPETHKRAAGLLAAAVAGVPAPGGYANPLVPLTELQATFEQAVQVLAADGAFEPAVAVAESYRVVAVGGRDREKRAEAFAAWGAALQKTGGDAAAKFTLAAQDYAALAADRAADTDKAELYRRAAGLYRRAGNPAASLAALESVTKLPKLPDESSGPVWVEYAEGLLAADRPDAALTAFKRAMATTGPTSTIARHRLARLLLDTRDPKKVPLGIDLLAQIAQAERVDPVEQEAHERALVELAHENILAGNFAEAESRLRTQIKLYPTGSEAGLGKLLLGVSLLQRADPKATPAAPDPVKARDEALKLFKEVVAEVAARSAASRAAERDGWLRTQANLRILQTYQQMAKHYDVLAAAGPLRRECGGTVDELIVLSLMYHAYKKLDKLEYALTIRDQMREVFETLKKKPAAFGAKSGEYSREYWEKVWFAPDAKK